MKSIRAKIMWLLFGGVLASSILIGALATSLTSHIISQNSNENMNLLCKTKADEIDILFAKIEDSVDTLAHFVESELPNAEALKDEAFRAEFSAAVEKSALHHIESTKDARAVYLYYDAAQLGKTEGFFYLKKETSDRFEKEQLTDISVYDEEDIGHVGWWHIPIKNGCATWMQSYYNENINQHVISYIVPIYKDDQLIGVIGADISTEHIAEKVKAVSVFRSGKAAILRSDGTVMYHPNFERDTVLGEGDPGFAGVVEKLSREEQTNELIPYKLKGVEKRLASCKLRNGMLMVCFAPVSEIYREQTNLTFATAGLTMLIVAFMLLLAFYVSGELARPIKRLNEAAKRLTEGEYDYHIHSGAHDEIGELTKTFIETRENLKQKIHLLDVEAHRDGLTGVGNKSAFIDREKEINAAIAGGTAAFGVAVFDVNKLKITNDVFGHMAGDKLLCAVSNHLSQFFGAKNIFRLGGDEFIVVIEDGAQADEMVRDCIGSMRSVLVEGYPDCRVSCACGVSQFDQQMDQNLTNVLRRADQEMYKNKSITKKEIFPWQEGVMGIKELQVEKYCQLLQTLMVSTDDYLFLMNLETGIIRFFGKDPNFFEIADGQDLSAGIADMLARVHPKDHAPVREAISAVIKREAETVDITFRMYNVDKKIEWVNCRGSIIKDDLESSFVVIGRISQNAIKHLYSPLTTLFNKQKLKTDLQNEDAAQFNCLMLLDIDNLSEINLKYGSDYGDNLLKLLAEELENRFSMHQIYHAEKDRFVALLNIASGKEAEQIFEELKATLAGKCSISASVVPNDRALYVSTESIYDYAVQILNNAKRNNVGQIVFFTKESILERISAVELLGELEESVKNKCCGFHLVYQPQIDANDYSLRSAEALLRYDSPTQGKVFPDQFIPILEKTGLIHEVGLWVIDKSLHQCKKWRAILPDFKISINVSPKQLEKKKLSAQILRLLAKYDLPGEALIVEITESAQLDKNKDTLLILGKLKNAGIQIAIDDFGTGYSNLGNLKQTHASILKVDRFFIRDVRENGYNYNLIHNIIEFAKKNALKVCLEGVETKDQLAVLTALEPDIFQGYLFDKPFCADELEAKYMRPETNDYAQRVAFIEQLKQGTEYAPLRNMETKTILQGIGVGLWMIRINPQSGEGALYSDETMRKLLGVDDKITPRECYDFWYGNIVKEYSEAVDTMVAEMSKTDIVVQVEYFWNHPVKGKTKVRCTGRCVEKSDETIVFEGFHRCIGDTNKIP